MTFEEFLQLITKYGWLGTLGSLALYLMYLLLKNDIVKYISKYLGNLSTLFGKKSKNVPRTISQSDILNHDIFNYIDFWKYSKIPTFNFSTEYRTHVFRKYLTLFLKNWKENLENYINSKKFEEMDSSELWRSFLSLINDVIYDYEREMEAQNIPKIIIEKMKSKNNDIVSLTINLLEGICSSQFYESEKNYLKVYSILNIILSILENTISNSEITCNSINGQLKGLKFSDGGKIYVEPN
ncbi:hypothetical protein EBU71_01955 [bacterium]|nr:hypothetical protein [Candidatus Elulimicrobium humile]